MQSRGEATENVAGPLHYFAMSHKVYRWPLDSQWIAGSKLPEGGEIFSLEAYTM